MALVSLFFTTRAQIAQMELDASINETHSATAKLASSPIEDGSDISDNITLDPLKLTMDGVVSKTPLNASALLGSFGSLMAGVAQRAAPGGPQSLAGAAALVGVGSIAGLASSKLLDANPTGSPKSREPKDIWEYLIELRNRRIPFDVVTALRKYENMVLTSVEVVRNAQNSGMTRFSAVMEQVTLVRADEVDVTGASSLLGGAAAAKSNLGKQGAGAASSKITNDASILFNVFMR